MDNKEIIRLTALELSRKIEGGELTSRQVTDAFIERIEQVEPQVHAFIVTTFDEARKTADEIDKKRQDGEKLHPLAGVPIAIKDVVVTKGIQTTAGSKMLEGWIPPYDASLVVKIKEIGMPILGKTNMDEFAMGSSTEHSAYGKTCNPWDLDRIPGGSGGGSAAAVAAFEAPLAIGTDTGGSIRQPAAVTGTVGAKPTYGYVSRYGLVALSSSLDQAGPCSRTVIDSALLQDVIQGPDYHDSTSQLSSEVTAENSNYQAALEGLRIGSENDGLKGVKVGVVKQMQEGFAPEVFARFQEEIEALEEKGAEIIEVDCPHFEYALGAYYLIMPSEASSNLARFDGMRYGQRVDGASSDEMMANTRGAMFGEEVKRRILLGTYALSAGYYDAYYGSAQKVRTLIQKDFAEAFAKVDFIATPTAPTVAFKFGEKIDDPLAMYMNDIATIPANLAGIPGLSLPSGLAEEGLPAGIQILVPAKSDDKMYKFAAAIEAMTDKLPEPKGLEK
ncbi:MAG: Asp-tRNA(Asn)/Glu-tRNA(Gln) amidotransferase subunit GatA [Candidatus Ancillula sp.]|jgi:aspartyl-tRNA(Asn)/glutamyl-tRNA(Gln) amidotransferase subunit A|nr:Asp-tRNA(Asn)/Glu-tRNA(Gln) amidotransferase subunit GatA [Candidatus Ancillula sp.]